MTYGYNTLLSHYMLHNHKANMKNFIPERSFIVFWSHNCTLARVCLRACACVWPNAETECFSKMENSNCCRTNRCCIAWIMHIANVGKINWIPHLKIAKTKDLRNANRNSSFCVHGGAEPQQDFINTHTHTSLYNCTKNWIKYWIYMKFICEILASCA